MNIKELQIKKAFKEATMILLRRGRIPTFSQINEYVKNKFERTPAGLPSFKPMLGKKYDCSNPQEYNFMMGKIKSDLDDLYDADNIFNNDIISAFNYYDTEKKLVDNMINDIQNRLDNLLDNINNPVNKESIFDNFDDFTKIDFIGNEERNISRTTSYVDLLNKAASNDTNYVKQIPIKDASIVAEIKEDVVDNITLSDIRYCLNDNINEAWIQSITSTKDTGVNVRLMVELKGEQEINTIKYYVQSPRKVQVSLSIINGDKQVKKFKSVDTRDNAEWNFKTTKVKAIVFDIFKSEPDAISGTNFKYFIGVKKINIFNNSHNKKSILVSNPFPISKPFSIIQTKMDQVLPPQTSIKYFIGIDNGNNYLSWMKINDNDITDLNILDKAKTNISAGFTMGYGSVTRGGYCLATLKHEPVANTSKLYLGINMWEKRVLDISDGNFDLRNLVSSDNITFHKMDTTVYKIPTKSAMVLTTNVYCEKSAAIKINSTASSNDVKTNIYVNSIKIEEIDNNYVIRLAQGWNQIQVLCINTGNNTRISLDAYFNDVASIVRAIKDSAQEVPLDELLYNCHENVLDKFAIVNNNVIVNYNPAVVNVEASMEYRYTNTPEFFDNANIRLMAVFESLADDVTPKLNNYKITTL